MIAFRLLHRAIVITVNQMSDRRAFDIGIIDLDRVEPPDQVSCMAPLKFALSDASASITWRDITRKPSQRAEARPGRPPSTLLLRR